MPMISAADPASHVVQTFPTVEALGEAIFKKGFVPVRPDGTVYITQSFEGGLLLDGAPLNVYYRNGWYPEQREMLQDHWGRDVPTPPQNIISLPLITDEEAQKSLAQYHYWKENEQGRVAGIPITWLLVGGLVIGGWWFFRH